MVVATRLALEIFDESVARFKEATKAAITVSEANIGLHHTGRQNRALFLFAKLIAHDISMLTILDRYNQSPKGAALLDHFSIASLSRTIIDASVMTMYISHTDLSRDGWNLRRYVLYLHDLTNRKRFLTAIKSEDKEFFASYPGQKSILIEKIQRFSRSLRLSKEASVDLISGQKVFVDGVRGAVREAGWDVKHFDFNQSYLSAFIHSHPVSFMRAEEHEISFSDPSDFQLGLSALAINVALQCTESVERRMNTFGTSGTGDPLGQVDD